MERTDAISLGGSMPRCSSCICIYIAHTFLDKLAKTSFPHTMICIEST